MKNMFVFWIIIDRHTKQRNSNNIENVNNNTSKNNKKYCFFEFPGKCNYKTHKQY